LLCLKQLQKQCPQILLTPKEMHRLEWSACYIPAMASALTSVMQRSLALQQESLPLVNAWSSDCTETDITGKREPTFTSNELDNDKNDSDCVEFKIEGRLRQILQGAERKREKIAIVATKKKVIKDVGRTGKGSPCTVEHFDEIDDGEHAEHTTLASVDMTTQQLLDWQGEEEAHKGNCTYQDWL
jgi:hypothetical protein